MSLKDDHLENGNIFVCYMLSEDYMCKDLGYKFLGIGKDSDGQEIHLWQIKTVTQFNKDARKRK
jgi:microsomal dipeptidase-like Zn-dependent dipeptidase